MCVQKRVLVGTGLQAAQASRFQGRLMEENEQILPTCFDSPARLPSPAQDGMGPPLGSLAVVQLIEHAWERSVRGTHYE